MPTDTLNLFKALADPVRLRILRAVSIAEMSVAELVSVLGLPQSTVSRHLKPLRDVELVEARRDATSVFYHRGPSFDDEALTDLLDHRLQHLPEAKDDQLSVRRVIDQRKQLSREFFDRIAGSYHSLTEPGGGWRALSAGLAVGFAGKTVADVGSGEGELALLLAPVAKKIICIDQSPRMLEEVEARAREAGHADRIGTAAGDLEAIPLPDASVDAVFLSQALHHAAQPEAAVMEASRILKRKGHLVILDLARHAHEWVREEWADLWLGFEPAQVRAWMSRAGVGMVHERRLSGATPDLPILLAIGSKNGKQQPKEKK